jgi:hypothetical protein
MGSGRRAGGGESREQAVGPEATLRTKKEEGAPRRPLWFHQGRAVAQSLPRRTIHRRVRMPRPATRAISTAATRGGPPPGVPRT